MTIPRRLLLLSGGMDSIAIAWWLRPEACLTIDYGQVPAQAEIRAAQAAASAMGLEHHLLQVGCRVLGSGDLAGQPPAAIAPVREWWPFRNQLLVTCAAAWAVTRGFQQILLGTIASDGVHVDGTAAFMDHLSRLLAMQEGGITLAAPALHLQPEALIATSRVPMEILSWAHSCHVSDLACGRCRGCNKHANTMEACGHAPY